MKYLKNVLVSLIILMLLKASIFINPSNAFLFGENRMTLNGKELIPYGEVIMLEQGEKVTVSDSSIAEIHDGYIKIIGVGDLTINSSIYGSISCYVWNVHLVKGHYYYYSDEAKTQKAGIISAPSYLGVSNSSSGTLKVTSYLKYSERESNIKNMYIENFYDSGTKKSKSTYFEYSFEKESPVFAPEVKSIAITSPSSGTYKPGKVLTIRITFSDKVTGTAPTLKLKFGNKVGTGKTTKSNPDGYKDYIDYKYVTTSKDSGKASISSYYGGSLKNKDGIYVKIEAKSNSGNSVTIKKTTTTSSNTTHSTNTTSTTTTTTTKTSKTFLYWAKKCHDYIAKNKWSYDNAHRRPNMSHYFANKISYKQIDCSAYVSWVLYKYTKGKFNKSLKSYNFVSKCSSSTYFKKLGFKVIKGQVTKSKCKAGDILLVNGHVEIYIGNGKSYSAGSTSAIRTKNGTSTNFKRFNYIIRPISK